MPGRWFWPVAAAVVMAIGAGLRLYALDAMEFKGDERETLILGIRLITEHHWSLAGAWPTYGLISSNGVGNAPLFTWIIAAFWAVTHDPLGVTALIAVTNVLTLYPLWRWARRRMDEFRALMTIAMVAVSPFFVLFSRKIWAPDLMLAALLSVLWAIEWWRGGRPWRAVLLLLVAVLVVGQLHQTGPIALALLPIALVVQVLVDRHRGRPAVSWPRPSRLEVIAIVAMLAVNAYFYLPYLRYFLALPPEVFAKRPVVATFYPEMLKRVALQVVPTDIFYFFYPHRFPFLDSDWRRWFYTAAVDSAYPLLIYGGWRWLRAPLTLPVLGVWWLLIIGAFAAARILTHEYYVLILAPLTAVLPAGGFDSGREPAWFRRALALNRVAHVVALFALSAATISWLAYRGGADGEYGITYSQRVAQARALADGDRRTPVPSSGFTCAAIPLEVRWLADRLAPTRAPDEAVSLCDGWVVEGDQYNYRWVLVTGP